ncbi:MAG: IclR family transcriptional regulator [Rubrivivax sp.]|nr:MAG: IclR family transcriptional regulator [Rubrivivax sp.]
MPRAQHTPPTADEPKSTSPAVGRAARILDLVARSARPLSMSELGRDTGLPKSSLHGLCETLVNLRLLRRADNGAMSMGPHVMTWANAFLAHTNILQEFYAAWQDSGLFTTETITLSVLDGRDVVYIACQNGSRPLDVTFRNGMRLPAPFTATGKAMLSTLPDAEVHALLGDVPWPSLLTRRSVGSFEALLPELAGCRANGYSIDDAQVRDGMHCFGAAVFDASSQQRAVAGLAVSFLAVDLDKPDKAQEIGRDIRTLADRLSTRLGAPVHADRFSG